MTCIAVGYSRHILESISLPAVTQTRVSEDYHESATGTVVYVSFCVPPYLFCADQWNIGTTSMFAYAIGLAPSKVRTA